MPRKKKSSAPAAPPPLTGPQRLNKLLAAAGLGSRREVEQYIVDGRIEVDGEPVTDLATKVDPEAAKISFDGSAIRIFRPVYFALNKPTGVLSTNRDPSGRMRAIDLVNVKERIFSAGRLDRSSEGLMLLTNDGELAQRLAHPRYGIQKLYLATVQGEVTREDLEKLIRGVRLAEGYAKVDAVKVRRQRSGAAELEIALSEGKNREIRRILARLGHKVVGLRRLAIGPLRLGQLPPGGWRPLSRDEVQALYAATIVSRRKRRGTDKFKRSTNADAAQNTDDLAIGNFDESLDDEAFESEFMPLKATSRKPSRNRGAPKSKDRSFTDQESPIPLVDHADDSFTSSDFDDSDDDEEFFDDEFGGTSLDEEDDSEPFISLGNPSVAGTIIPYEDDEGEAESDDQASRPQRARRAPSPRGRKSGAASGSSRQSSTRSPHDLRNRKSATGGRRASPTGRSSSDSAPRSPKSRTAPKSPGARRPAAKKGAGKFTGSKPRGATSPRGGASESRGSQLGMGRAGRPKSGSRPKAGPSNSRSGPRAASGGKPGRPTRGGSSAPRGGSANGPRSGPGKPRGKGRGGRTGGRS